MYLVSKTNAQPVQQSARRSAPSSTDLSWLPNLPLTAKHKAPPICGVGILYSQKADAVLHVFETENLQEGINSMCQLRVSTTDLDACCQLLWMEEPNPARRTLIAHCLLARQRDLTPPQ